MMRMGSLTRAFVLIGAVSAANVACAARVAVVGEAEPPPAAPEPPPPVVYAQEPVLVTVEPGIWVVQDSDYPVYVVDDNYWVYRDNVWYRSRSYDGGWARVEVGIVPPTIVHRDHAQYVHYRGAPNAQRRAAPTEHPRTHYAQTAPNEHARPEAEHDAHAHPEQGKPEGERDARVHPGPNGAAAVHEGVTTTTPESRPEEQRKAEPGKAPVDDRLARERAVNAHEPTPTATPPRANPSVESRRVAPAPAPARRDTTKKH